MKKDARIKTDINQQEEILGMSPAFPFVKHFTDYSKNSVPWHWHPEFEIQLVLSGNLTVHTTAGDFVFKAGEAFFMNSNVLASKEGDDECTEDSFLFHSILLSGHFKSIFETKYILPIINNKGLEIIELRGENDNQKKAIARLRRISELTEKDGTEFLIRNELSLIWLALLDEIKNQDSKILKKQSLKNERLMTMMAYIHENFTGKITLENLSASAAISKREVLRCFQDGIHKSPFEYIKTYRIMKAEEMLKSSDMSITEISFLSGFSNSAYFTKTFREVTGMTPGAYRRTG